jgi:hypothetical protein
MTSPHLKASYGCQPPVSSIASIKHLSLRESKDLVDGKKTKYIVHSVTFLLQERLALTNALATLDLLYIYPSLVHLVHSTGKWTELLGCEWFRLKWGQMLHNVPQGNFLFRCYWVFGQIIFMTFFRGTYCFRFTWSYLIVLDVNGIFLNTSFLRCLFWVICWYIFGLNFLFWPCICQLSSPITTV